MDVNPVKLEWARRFGATDVVNAAAGDPVAAVRGLVKDDWAGYEGGVDFAFEATGLMKCIEQAVRMTSIGCAEAGICSSTAFSAVGRPRKVLSFL